MTLHDVTDAFIRTDIVVIDVDPEYADMSNPRGERYGYRASLVVEAPDGSRWEYWTTYTERFEDDARARMDRLAARVKRAIADGVRMSPACWTPARPCYGSDAYERAGARADD